MNAPAPITPPTGLYRVISVRGTKLGAERGPFDDRDEATRVLRASTGPAVLVRGSSVLEGRGVTSPAALAAIRARLAEGATAQAPAEEPAPPPVATPARTPREPRIGRPKPVPEGHCPGCDQAFPTHLTVCPYAPQELPGMPAAAPPVARPEAPVVAPVEPEEDDEEGEDTTAYTLVTSIEDIDAMVARDDARAQRRENGAPDATAPETTEDPMTTKTIAATPKRPRGRPRKLPVEAAPAAGEATADDCERCHRYPACPVRATTPKGTERCCRHCRRIEAMRAAGSTSATKRSQRGNPKPRHAKAATATKRPKVARAADPSDVLARELAALVGDLRRELMATIPSRDAVREVAREVVVEAVQAFRGALST